MSRDPFLRLEGLTKSFGDLRVVDGLSLAVAEGEVLALLGPSGSGKTTLLRLLAGFETPDAGSIRLVGREVSALPPAKRGFGMVFQHYALFPHLDVAGNVAFGLAAQGWPRERLASRVAEVLALVDLAGFETRPVAALSGGQQQRVAVARALAPEPRLLLLDEPLSNLDPALRERTRRALKALVRRVGITTVLVTHEQQEAFDLGDRIAVLWQGRLQQVGSPEALHDTPANPFVASFVGRASFLPGTLESASGDGGSDASGVHLSGVAGGRIWPGVAEAPMPSGANVTLMLRPEALQLAEPGSDNAVTGTVVERLYGGGWSHFRVVLDGTTRGDETTAGSAGIVEVEVLAPSATACVGGRVAVAPRPEGPPGRIWPRRTEPA